MQSDTAFKKQLADRAIDLMMPTFVGMMDEVKTLLRYAFQTRNDLTFPVSGPGSLGMETCFVNLVTPGDKVIVCVNGVFGGRMVENVKRIGATPVAGHQIAVNMVSLMFMMPLALSNATTTLVAQSIGADDLHGARRLGLHGLQVTLALAACTGVLVYLLISPYYV